MISANAGSTSGLTMQGHHVGEVTEVKVVEGLSHGLTERAIEAAKRITFVPAESNGKKVSFRMTLEYYFNLY